MPAPFRPFRWKQWFSFEETEEEREPQAAQRDQFNEVQPVQKKSIGMKSRSDEPEVCHDGGRANKERDPPQAAAMRLCVTRQEKRERYEKLSQENGESEPLPAAVAALEIPRNLFRQIARLDD